MEGGGGGVGVVLVRRGVVQRGDVRNDGGLEREGLELDFAEARGGGRVYDGASRLRCYRYLQGQV